MLFPWNLVSLHRFKKKSLFLFLRGNSTLCSCSWMFFSHIWGERQLAWFSAMLWFPSALWQEDPAEHPQKACVSSTELPLWCFSVMFLSSSPVHPALGHKRAILQSLEVLQWWEVTGQTDFGGEPLYPMPCISSSWQRGSQSRSQADCDGASCGSETFLNGINRQLC